MVTETDLLTTTKAIRDEVRAMLNASHKSTRIDLSAEVFAGLEKMVTSRLVKMQEATDQRLKAIEELHQKNIGLLQEHLHKSMTSLNEQHHKTLQLLDNQRQEDVKRLEMSYLVGMENMVKVLKSLPTPQVSYTAPEVKVMPPNIHLEPRFSVPEQQAPTINVNVPQQEAPTVNVNVPAQEKSIVNVSVPVPEVRVEVPKNRPMRKHIEHDQYGRAVVITEEEV